MDQGSDFNFCSGGRTRDASIKSVDKRVPLILTVPRRGLRLYITNLSFFVLKQLLKGQSPNSVQTTEDLTCNHLQSFAI